MEKKPARWWKRFALLTLTGLPLSLAALVTGDQITDHMTRWQAFTGIAFVLLVIASLILPFTAPAYARFVGYQDVRAWPALFRGRLSALQTLTGSFVDPSGLLDEREQAVRGQALSVSYYVTGLLLCLMVFLPVALPKEPSVGTLILMMFCGLCLHILVPVTYTVFTVRPLESEHPALAERIVLGTQADA